MHTAARYSAVACVASCVRFNVLASTIPCSAAVYNKIGSGIIVLAVLLL
jgi:hypothetical protein